MIFGSIIMFSWSENWMPLLLFTPEFILMAAKKHHNHTESEIVDMQTQWTLCAKLKLLPVCGCRLERLTCSRFEQLRVYSYYVFHIHWNIRLLSYVAGMWATPAKLSNYFYFFVGHIYFWRDGDIWRWKYYYDWEGLPWKHRYSSWNFVFMCFRNQITP